MNCSECQNNKKQFMYTTCSELVIFMFWTGNSMNNMSSYCGLVDPRISAPDKDLPVQKQWQSCIDWNNSMATWSTIYVKQSDTVHKCAGWDSEMAGKSSMPHKALYNLWNKPLINKVQTFWESHKNLAYLPLFFWHYLKVS